MKTYGVGVFGIGWVAGEHIRAYMQNPYMEVKALASRRKESAQAKKDELGLDCDILDDYESLLERNDLLVSRAGRVSMTHTSTVEMWHTIPSKRW